MLLGINDYPSESKTCIIYKIKIPELNNLNFITVKNLQGNGGFYV